MGRLQPRLAWDHKIYTVRKLGGAKPSATTENTHAPRPGGMPIGGLRYLPPWPLCTVCARKGVDNLLNHTLPMAGTSGSTKQVWGLLEQDSIYGRLRRLIISLYDMYNNYISTNRQNHHSSYLILPYRTQPSRLGTRDKLVSTQDRDFLGILLVGMKGIRG